MRCLEPRIVKVGYSLKPATNTGSAQVPCGVCLHCRIDQERVWRTRLHLEWMNHGCSAFVSLTYDDDHLPDPPHVSRKDLLNYVRKIRYNIDPINLRYFGVGEYGPRTLRPHYHIILFGIDANLQNALLKRCWTKSKNKEIGIVAEELNAQRIGYITGYISKKVQKVTGEHPTAYGKRDEFMVASNRAGGIGKPTVEKMIKTIQANKNLKRRYYTKVNIGHKQMPLGRLLKEQMNNWQNITWQEKLLKFASEQLNYFDNRMNYEKFPRKILDKRATL